MKLTDLNKLLAPDYKKPLAAYRPGRQNAQFPGQEIFPGATIEQIREFIRKQKRCKGYQINIPAGQPQPVQLDISGTAQLLLGLNIITLSGNTADPANYPNKVALTVNDEIVIQQLHGIQLSPVNLDDEYYFFPRPLSGQDDVTLTLESPVARQISVAVYYI